MKRKRPETWQGRAVLTREAIGRAVLDTVAEVGANGLSTRRIAEHLGVSPRALYNYVSGKDDAIAAAGYVAQSQFALPPLDDLAWQAGVRTLCDAYRAWYRQFPELVRLASGAPMVAHPTMLDANERCFGFLRRIGIPDSEVGGTWTVLTTTLAGYAEIDAWFQRIGAAADRPAGAAASQTLTADQYPHTLAVQRAGSDVGADATYEGTIAMITAWISTLRDTTHST
ncbi:TetR/AcrR family transcriptional regulator [Leucobacter sp. 7(1)]|uniref:TetR/AcrR family transcriptional regulator n=1 Tax=Leucobacter sp. 7(1) TaxID=1255613 RepID=UPI0015955348|nr:TetR/AcrR family transcriptional regulator [Leucobacter sp. 7(1)]